MDHRHFCKSRNNWAVNHSLAPHQSRHLINPPWLSLSECANCVFSAPNRFHHLFTSSPMPFQSITSQTNHSDQSRSPGQIVSLLSCCPSPSISPFKMCRFPLPSAVCLLSLFLLFLISSDRAFGLPKPDPKPLFGIGIGRTQSAGAEGTLLCQGEPVADVLVKLYDDDRGVDADDFMGQTRTDSKGRFRVEGYTHEFTTIDPKINIYHDCDDGLTPCQRKISIMIPDKYIASDEHPETYFDAGRIELEGKFKGEERDCIH